MKSEIDARGLIFVRICFGSLMLIYSASKLGDDMSHIDTDMVRYGFQDRIPPWLYDIVTSFPYYTNNIAYWSCHNSLMFLSAAFMCFGFGVFSRFGAFLFAILKMVLTLVSQNKYNNHEYMYATLSLLLSILDGHDAYFSILGKASRKRKKGGSTIPVVLMIMGVSYLIANNIVYGIAGQIALIGMVCFIWPSIILVLTIDTKATIDKRPMVSPWQYYVLQIYIGYIYLCAGIAKTGQDWLSGSVIIELFKRWAGPTVPHFLRNKILALDAEVDFSSMGNRGSITLHTLAQEVTSVIASSGESSTPILSAVLLYGMVYGGLLIDLLHVIVMNSPIVSFKVAFTALTAIFHACNHYFFIIETFPWVMLSTLSIYYSSSWIDKVGTYLLMLLRYIHMQEVYQFSIVIFRYAMVLVVILLLAVHIGLAVPCNLYAFFEEGNVTWGSQCQYFSWRMMTRSVNCLPVNVNIQDPVSKISWKTFMKGQQTPEGGGSEGENRQNEITYRALQRYFGNEEVAMTVMRQFVQYRYLDSFLQDSCAYEDRILTTIKEYSSKFPLYGNHQQQKERAAEGRVSLESNEDLAYQRIPAVYADIWIEINGPPYQRYIHPSVDLAASKTVLYNNSNTSMLTYLTRPPRPLGFFVTNRAVEFRTDAWKASYRQYTHQVKSKATTYGHRVEAIFFSDIFNGPAVDIVSRHDAVIELKLLSGQALILNHRKQLQSPVNGKQMRTQGLKIATNTTIQFIGSLIVRTIGNDPTLWCLVAFRKPVKDEQTAQLGNSFSLTSALDESARLMQTSEHTQNVAPYEYNTPQHFIFETQTSKKSVMMKYL